jgi:hypothetical protein
VITTNPLPVFGNDSSPAGIQMQGCILDQTVEIRPTSECFSSIGAPPAGSTGACLRKSNTGLAIGDWGMISE